MELRFLKKKDRPFLVLDVGTEAVKSLIVEKDSKIRILGSGISYIEDEEAFNKNVLAGDLEMEMIRRAIKSSVKEASASAIPFLKKGERLKDLEVILSLSPKKLGAEVIKEVSVREEKDKKIKKSEREAILDDVLKSARENTFKKGFNNLGLLPRDIEIVSLDVLDREIEGYSVPSILGCQGRDLAFKILIIFGSKTYIDDIVKILEDLSFEVSRIVHLSQTISPVFAKKAKDKVFFDIGGEATQIFLLSRGILSKVELFDRGGDDFTERIFDGLNLNRKDARILKERYSNKSLDPETALRVKEMLSNERGVWRENIRKYQKSPVLLFGGSANLLEIKSILKNRKVVRIKNFEKVEDLSKTKGSQFVPAVLTSLI